MPVALVLDGLAAATVALASISERRLYRLLDPATNNGLPAFLVDRSGLNSGFMIVQYTAASLVSESKSLAHPASVDSIPSSAGQEDHVSMGMIAARHARQCVANAEVVIARDERKLRWQDRLVLPGVRDWEYEFVIQPLEPGRVVVVQLLRSEGLLAPFTDEEAAREALALIGEALAERVTGSRSG